ncbi:MAG: 4Fe-4S binding protein, partial [Deltaproteobacteria bacterium]|nr:4Fe-4S binding protein [Deltaproteobacteria bacterium]
MRFQRILQIPLFGLFLLLLWLAAFPLATWLEVDFFLRLDPLISIGSMITARSLISRVAWALLIMGAALILGRFFCGYLCPMGATIDVTDWLFRRKRKGNSGNSFEKAGQWRGVKYLLLVFVLAS